MKINSIIKHRFINKEWIIDQKAFITLFLLIIVSVLNPNFFSVDNIFNILRQTSINAIIEGISGASATRERGEGFINALKNTIKNYHQVNQQILIDQRA